MSETVIFSPFRSSMFDALHRLLTGLDQPNRAAEENDSAFALAVLLIDVARSDDRVVDHEEGGIIRISPAIRCSITFITSSWRACCACTLLAPILVCPIPAGRLTSERWRPVG
jgi:hypothetical protein